MLKKIIAFIKEKKFRFEKKIKENKKVRLVILGCFCIFLLLFTYFFLNYRELVKVYTLEENVSNKLEDMEILLGGEAVGIKLLATGVLVMGVDREDCEIKIGDIILSVNDKKIESNSELENITKASNGNKLNLKINRQGQEVNLSLSPILNDITNEYKLGLWVKDSSAGVGTVTFYDLNSKNFAALGHGVTETKENYILPITAGGITSTKIYSVKKGIAKVPGEIKGTLTNEILGQITGNTDKGIYGKITERNVFEGKEKIEIMSKSEIKEGKASICCTLEDNIKRLYEINIEKVLLTSSGNKNMIIKITDELLLEKTGGIIQGMSGSPIIQEGKLVGAVTHVFLNDPTRGYGVFIENMIDDMSKF